MCISFLAVPSACVLGKADEQLHPGVTKLTEMIGNLADARIEAEDDQLPNLLTINFVDKSIVFDGNSALLEEFVNDALNAGADVTINI